MNRINRNLPSALKRSENSVYFEIEQQGHKTFSAERAPDASFVGRKQELDLIRKYVLGEGAYTNGLERFPLVIHGDIHCNA